MVFISSCNLSISTFAQKLCALLKRRNENVSQQLPKKLRSTSQSSDLGTGQFDKCGCPGARSKTRLCTGGCCAELELHGQSQHSALESHCDAAPQRKGPGRGGIQLCQ